MPGAAPAAKVQATAPEPPLRLQPARAPAPPTKAPDLSLASGIQAKRFVSSPGDAAEREADRVAHHVMTMPAPTAIGVSRTALHAQRAPAVTAAPATTAAANDRALESQVKTAATGGMQLSRKTRAFLEPRFRADFGGVAIHTDAAAVKLSNQIGARAFTYGRHIFFNSGQYNPDSQDGLELLAHELTHTIQQSETIQRKAAEPEAPRVQERIGPQASRLGISDVLDYFADKANMIPGYRMFTILIGVNPINMSSVEASAANILRAIVEFLPGGNIITRVLDSYGVFDKVGNWIEAQLKSLGISGSAIKAAIDRFIDSLGWRDIFHLGSVWDRAKAIFSDPIGRILSFARSLFGKILEFVQQAVLKPLAVLASNTPFYPLLKAVLGKDPVTGEPVQGGASEVIGGFMTMIGQQELWGNIQRANAIPRAWAWFQTAMKGLLGIVLSIPDRFIGLLKSLEIMDFVVLPRAFAKIGGVLASFLSDFGSWALGTIFDLLKIIMEVVAPGVMPYIYKAGAAFRTIIKDPVRFIKTLVAAAMQGFRQFAANFLTHLQASLVGWLTGAMAGANIYIPQGFNLREILKFVLSVLGLTWANIRGKLVRATNETTVVALETGFDIVLTLVRDGPAAAWQKILETLSNLKQMAIDAIMDFVKSRVVEAAVTKLLSMLSPAGALIQAIIAIYNTIMFFVERLKQIAAVAASFIDALATIAAGNIGPAANRVETTMAGLLTLVISFLARIAGLGKVADAVTGLIAKIRAPIDKALDRVVDWIVTQAKKLGKMLMGDNNKPTPAAPKDVPSDGEIGKTVPFSAPDGGHKIWIDKKGTSAEPMMASTPKPLLEHLKDFKAMAKDLDQPSKGTVLAAIGSATALAKTIDKNAKRSAKKEIGTSDRDTLDKSIETDQTTLAPILKSILDELGIKVPDATDPITISFVRNPKLNQGEYNRQLAGQAAGINAMSVEIWISRRAEFAVMKAKNKEETGNASGRDPRSAKAQQDALKAKKDLLIQRLGEGEGSTSATAKLVDGDSFLKGIVSAVYQGFAASTRAKGIAASTAENALEPWFGKRGVATDKVAALHEPDQVVGGRQRDANQGIVGLGLGDVNSDIGANWGGLSFGGPARQPLAKNLEKDVKDFMRKKKIAKAFWVKVSMKIVLK